MKIILAIDDSDSSREALRALLTQFRPEGSAVLVLNVVEPIEAYISADFYPHFTPQIAEVEQDRQKQAKELVENTAGELSKAGFKTSAVVDHGPAKTVILDHAKEWNADLIVMGSHGLKGLNRFLMGSVSEAVSRHAECSVEIVRMRKPPVTQ